MLSQITKIQVVSYAILLCSYINRVVGVPAQGEILQEMIDLLREGKAQEAALLATEHPFFYDFKLRALFTPWSNREGSVSNPLNDMVATMTGMVRDDVPFNTVLSEDIVYVHRPEDLKNCEHIYGTPREYLPKVGCKVLPDGTASVNTDAGASRVGLHNLKNNLQRYQQSQLDKQAIVEPSTNNEARLEASAISGVLSTRAFAAAFYSDGTNRRATSFVLKNFLCHEMEQLHDIETPKHWVRQDVNRSPGGDPELFNQRCVGCHAGMDALSGWSVYYDGFSWTAGKVQNKIYKNNLLTEKDKNGNTVSAPNKDEGRNYSLSKNQNDSFTNLWTEGKNASLGWRGETSGKGAKEFGEMITRSKVFSSCMARHVYKAICYLDPEEGLAKTKHEQLADQFEKNNYNMRKLFAATAVSCLTKEKEESTGSGGEEE